MEYVLFSVILLNKEIFNSHFPPGALMQRSLLDRCGVPAAQVRSRGSTLVGQLPLPSVVRERWGRESPLKTWGYLGGSAKLHTSWLG